MEALQPHALAVEVVEHADRDAFRAWWHAKRGSFGSPRAAAHESSPAVWLSATDFLGGADDTLAWLRANFLAGQAVSRPPRVQHASDARAPGAADRGAFEYDLVVIGGGSGGMAASKEAVRQLKLEAERLAEAGDAAARVPEPKVAVLDFVKPSWQGTTWGLGGTCVNVGCIPKKLMHTAALLGQSLGDARALGWAIPGGEASADAAHSAGGGVAHSWDAMVTAVQDHVASLNFGYKVALKEEGVEYKNALGTLTDAHTVELTDKKGKKSSITARRILVAVGGRPKPLEIPGGELALSSDDIFSLSRAPGKTLVVGASYVALECAGFLAGLGFPTTVLVRSILLRGFDQQMAEKIGEHMAQHGVAFVRPATPLRIEKPAAGRLRVTWRIEAPATGTEAPAPGAPAPGSEHSEEFDSVFTATGRYADTGKLGLAAAGVKTDRDGKVVCEAEQSVSVPHIYAVGDVVSGKPELTPVAIAAGKKLARRLYGGSAEGMDYEKVPTTVFTPLEYGCIGLSEEAALERFGEAQVEVYHSTFTPLEWTVVPARSGEGAATCYAKLVVHKADANRVVGFHVLGPNAGEVTQGWACAMRLGATYESFCETVGIHPTLAEEFTTLSITKSSGVDAGKTGC